MSVLSLRAPAKLNLFLHITGRRADGYHLLESLVAFAELADTLTIEPSESLTLEVRGAFADAAGDHDKNLVMRAAVALQNQHGVKHGARMVLTKNIPVGAGLGGGSSDAAAALNGLNRVWQLGRSDAQLRAIAVTLGADVAMCLNPQAAIVRGIGEELSPLTQPFAPIAALLVHPRIPLLTKDVYAALGHTQSASLTTEMLASDMRILLAKTRNDLQRAAIAVNPLVAELLLTLETLAITPRLVRMSGSGACCFALYDTMDEATRAQKMMEEMHPNWWACATMVG